MKLRWAFLGPVSSHRLLPLCVYTKWCRSTLGCFLFIGKICFVAPTFLTLARPSEPLGLPFLFNRWLFSTEVWYNAQPLAFGRASVVSVHAVSEFAPAVYWEVPFHLYLLVLGFTLSFASAVCHRFVGPCCHQFLFSYGFIFETMAYSCNLRCPVVSCRVTPQALRKANWGGEPCH